MWDALFSGIDWIYTGPIAIGYALSWLFLILGKKHKRLFGILERTFEALFLHSLGLETRLALFWFGLHLVPWAFYQAFHGWFRKRWSALQGRKPSASERRSMTWLVGIMVVGSWLLLLLSTLGTGYWFWSSHVESIALDWFIVGAWTIYLYRGASCLIGQLMLVYPGFYLVRRMDCAGLNQMTAFKLLADGAFTQPRSLYACIGVVCALHWPLAIALLALVSALQGFAERGKDESHRIWHHHLFRRDADQQELASLSSKQQQDFRLRNNSLMVWLLALITNSFVFLWSSAFRGMMHEWYTLLQNGRVVFRRAAFRDVVGQLKLGVYAVRTDEKWLVPDNADLLHAVRGDSFCWLYSGHYLSGSKGLVSAREVASELDHVIVAVPSSGSVPESLEWLSKPMTICDFIESGDVRQAGLEEEGAMDVEGFNYSLKILDEERVQIGDVDLGALMNRSALELNVKLRHSLPAGWEELYSGGVFDLNVLHRRVHEFPEAASRFLELLNVWELVARWMVIVEGVEEYEQEEETLRISFGKTCADVRKTAFMQSKLGVPEDGKLMEEVREYWKEAFNWTASMSQNPTVEEAFGWMVYIRNKTRGHGSTSRIKEELYIVVEALTFLLLDRVKDHADLEIMVRDVKKDGTVFFTRRHGMRLDFMETEDSSVSSLVGAESDVHFRKVGEEDWRNSNLLKAENGHVFLLNEIRKGHREWVCFSTGELIRPASIFDA